jgi:hypothetical protein
VPLDGLRERRAEHHEGAGVGASCAVPEPLDDARERGIGVDGVGELVDDDGDAPRRRQAEDVGERHFP